MPLRLRLQVHDEDRPHPRLMYLSNAAIASNHLGTWIDQMAARDRPLILCVGEPEQTAPQTGHVMTQRRIDLLAIEQNAWVLAARDPRCVVVSTRTELDWAMKRGKISVWAPSKMVLDAVDKPVFGAKPLDLAAWFAAEFSADHVSILGSGPFRDKMQVVAEPSMLG